MIISKYLRNHVLEGLHDLGWLRLLVVREDSGDDNNCCEDDSKIQVVIRRLLHCCGLDEVGHEAEDSTKPEQHCKTSKEVLQELDPFWSCWRWSQAVHAMLLLTCLDLNKGQSSCGVCSESSIDIVNRNFVNIDFQLFLQVIKTGLLALLSCNGTKNAFKI